MDHALPPSPYASPMLRSLHQTAGAKLVLCSFRNRDCCSPSLSWPSPRQPEVKSLKLGRGIYRFYPSAEAQQAAPASLALQHPFKGTPVELGSAPVEPTFGFTDDFRYSAEVEIEHGTDLYGTGEAAGPLRRNGRVTECWNTDQPAYSEKDPSLYQSHPWVLAVRKDGTAFGVLADTTFRCRIDLRRNIRFEADGPQFGVIVIDRKNPQQVLEGLADLTGHMSLPSLWALGYHQCRWLTCPRTKRFRLPKSFANVMSRAETMWFDIDYMDGFRIFTFNSKTFPDPKALNAKLASMGFHNVWMIDPGVKDESGYPVYDSGKKADVFVKSMSGSDVSGTVWPGQCVFPDFTRPETRSWWARLYKAFAAQGITGVWNDMNEPSFFNVPTKTMPEDAQHRGGGELKGGPHAQYHNVFGMLMARATRDGLLAANPDKRPFLLTRAGYIGYQRYAATWTGDNSSSWTDSGMPFPWCSTSHFLGSLLWDLTFLDSLEMAPPIRRSEQRVLPRWWGVGSLLPFSRGHASKGTERKEPWAFGPRVEEAAREALWRRYVLMPYIYTAFYDSSITGLPGASPLFFADLGDAALRSEDGGFLLGGDLAVKADVHVNSRPVAMPVSWTKLPLDTSDPNLPLHAPRLHHSTRATEGLHRPGVGWTFVADRKFGHVYARCRKSL